MHYLSRVLSNIIPLSLVWTFQEFSQILYYLSRVLLILYLSPWFKSSKNSLKSCTIYPEFSLILYLSPWFKPSKNSLKSCTIYPEFSLILYLSPWFKPSKNSLKSCTIYAEFSLILYLSPWFKSFKNYLKSCTIYPEFSLILYLSPWFKSFKNSLKSCTIYLEFSLIFYLYSWFKHSKNSLKSCTIYPLGVSPICREFSADVASPYYCGHPPKIPNANHNGSDDQSFWDLDTQLTYQVKSLKLTTLLSRLTTLLSRLTTLLSRLTALLYRLTISLSQLIMTNILLSIIYQTFWRYTWDIKLPKSSRHHKISEIFNSISKYTNPTPNWPAQ